VTPYRNGTAITPTAVVQSRSASENSAPIFTLVIHGQNDDRIDVSQGFDLFTTLQRLKVPSKMLYFSDEGHWVLKPQNSRLWYKR
jgi:dipeptidyl aminopeptidase/acylaminoacyl peptidase